jgi:glycosyltransferase involved in cell wall biosynthesis
MKNKDIIREKMIQLNCCIVVPTYNNATVIGPVLEKLLEYTNNVMVVNDGSTDSTLSVLSNYNISIVSYTENRGKGFAIRTALKEADNIGYDYIITIDSDGQHNPDDLPLFLEDIEKNGEAIVLGARNMSQEGVPAKSSFGNKFSSFWFRLETGIKAPDTQTGFRCYPVKPLANRKYYTRKYEFEIEIIVRAAWSGIDVRSVPISVYYAPEEERISHFRPFKDFTRISILNTFLVLILLFYIKPRDLYRTIKKKSFKRFFKENVIHSSDSNGRMAFSVSLGVFMGIAPIWGWQMIVAVSVAHFFKLNKAITLIASNISLPPMIPVLLYMSYRAGGIIMGNSSNFVSLSNISFTTVKNDLLQYVLGALSFGIVMAIASGILTFILLLIFRKKK